MIYYRRAKPLSRQLCLISGVKWCQIVQCSPFQSDVSISFSFSVLWGFPIASYFRALLGNNKSCKYSTKMQIHLRPTQITLSHVRKRRENARNRANRSGTAIVSGILYLVSYIYAQDGAFPFPALLRMRAFTLSYAWNIPTSTPHYLWLCVAALHLFMIFTRVEFSNHKILHFTLRAATIKIRLSGREVPSMGSTI